MRTASQIHNHIYDLDSTLAIQVVSEQSKEIGSIYTKMHLGRFSAKIQKPYLADIDKSLTNFKEAQKKALKLVNAARNKFHKDITKIAKTLGKKSLSESQLNRQLTQALDEGNPIKFEEAKALGGRITTRALTKLLHSLVPRIKAKKDSAYKSLERLNKLANSENASYTCYAFSSVLCPIILKYENTVLIPFLPIERYTALNFPSTIKNPTALAKALIQHGFIEKFSIYPSDSIKNLFRLPPELLDAILQLSPFVVKIIKLFPEAVITYIGTSLTSSDPNTVQMLEVFNKHGLSNNISDWSMYVFHPKRTFMSEPSPPMELALPSKISKARQEFLKTNTPIPANPIAGKDYHPVESILSFSKDHDWIQMLGIWVAKRGKIIPPQGTTENVEHFLKLYNTIKQREITLDPKPVVPLLADDLLLE